MPPHFRAGMAAEITALLPVADLYRPQALGEFSLDPQPQEDQSLHWVSTFQNGDASVYPSLPEPGRLDCLHRSLRRISSCAYSRSVKRLARLYIQRKRLSPQSTALRAQARTSPIHEASRMRGCFPPSAGVANFLLPRRLTNGSHSPPPPSATAAPGPPVTDSAGPRFHYQLGQVGAHPDSVPDFPRGDYRYPRQLARPSQRRIATIVAAARLLRGRWQAPA